MKTTSGFLAKAFAITFASLAVAGQSFATLTVVAPDIDVSTYYTHSSADSVVSFDRDSSGKLYYLTTTAATFNNTNFWSTTGGSPTNLYSAPSNFPGASVVASGNYVYFGDGNSSSFIRGYGPLTGTPTTLLFSSTSTRNYYGLYAHSGSMFITGAVGFGTNEIFYSPLGADGDLTNEPAISLGVTSGSSGPLAFDSAGSLYYAPGFGDLSIYRWSAVELAAAIANPAGSPLSVTNHKWADYSTRSTDVDGASAMDFDAGGNLVVNLTRFGAPSFLVKFGMNGTGMYDGSNVTLLTDTGRLGEVRNFDGNLFVSSDNRIVEVVPEPSAALLVLAGLGASLARRRRS
jgi:hypothetical protein